MVLPDGDCEKGGLDRRNVGFVRVSLKLPCAAILWNEGVSR